MSGITPQQRLAIMCGNEPYADDIVCPICDGDGEVTVFVAHRAGVSAVTTVSGKRTCIECQGHGYVCALAVRRAK